MVSRIGIEPITHRLKIFVFITLPVTTKYYKTLYTNHLWRLTLLPNPLELYTIC